MDALKVKIQHYVPRSYLRRFTFDKAESKVRCFDKTKQTTFEPNVKNILCESYFYDTEQDVHQEVEKALGVIETVVTSALEQLLETRDVTSLNDDARFRIALFMAIQEHRTPDFRKKHVETIRKLKEKIGRMFASRPEALERFNAEQDLLLTADKMKSLQISVMKGCPEFASILTDMKWALINNPTDTPFWTSDHPVTRNNPVGAGPYGNMGLLCKGIMIHFPLSPKLCLFVGDPIGYGKTPDLLTCGDVENVNYINQFQVQRSTRFLISNKTSFKLAERMIKDHPNLADPDRDRIELH